MEKIYLTTLVDEGKSIAEISQICGKSKTAVRHWLTTYNLKTKGKAGNKTAAPVVDGNKQCSSCKCIKPISEFSVRSDRPGTLFPNCKSCVAADTKERAVANKKFFVDKFGNKCHRCGGSFHISQFDFHHTEPEHKDFTIGERKHATLSVIVKELEKCIMVCSNCHNHIHHEMKESQGIGNKISGNTELWRDNKKRKLDHIGRHSCDNCGYDAYEGSLGIVFKEEHKHYRKYNKTHWDEDFKLALSEASIVCSNCTRLTK